MRSKQIGTTLAVACVAAAVGVAGGIAGGSAATNGNTGGDGDGKAGGQAPPGPHIGANGQRERVLSGDVADKVRAAALAKVDGGTIERVETDADHGSPYEAHVRRSDGTELEVLVNKSFEVTAVNQMQHP
ncbi:MAG TPA: hypothetical protein VF056_08330 [Thermoleophilaceae bacterium]